MAGSSIGEAIVDKNPQIARRLGGTMTRERAFRKLRTPGRKLLVYLLDHAAEQRNARFTTTIGSLSTRVHIGEVTLRAALNSLDRRGAVHIHQRGLPGRSEGSLLQWVFDVNPDLLREYQEPRAPWEPGYAPSAAPPPPIVPAPSEPAPAVRMNLRALVEYWRAHTADRTVQEFLGVLLEPKGRLERWMESADAVAATFAFIRSAYAAEAFFTKGKAQ